MDILVCVVKKDSCARLTRQRAAFDSRFGSGSDYELIAWPTVIGPE